MKFKNYLIIAVIIFVFGFVGLVVVQACQPSVTPTISPCDYEASENQDCVTVSPTEPVATPSARPTIEVTPGPGNVPENPSDHRSDGLSSCPECTKAPVIPAGGPPSTGKAL